MQRDWGILLGEMLLLLFLPGGTQSCGVIAVESPVILLGAPLSASCTLRRESCRGLEKGVPQVVWKLDGDFIPATQVSSDHESTSTVNLRSFNKSTGFLSCYAKGIKEMQLVDRVQISAGYPPSPPSKLSCVMNLTDDSVTCSWDPGRDPLITTNVTLSIHRLKGQCGNLGEKKLDCIPIRGQSSCIIPREQFNPYQNIEIWVTVQNALGSAASIPLCLLPMDAVKLDPLTIQEVASVPSRPGCVNVRWKEVKKRTWLDQRYQLRYRREEEKQWTEPLDMVNGSMMTEHCSLLPATKYHFQIRCIKSSLRGHWSEWSTERSLVTLESAPTGKLVTWWRRLHATDTVRMAEFQLLWKALKREDANAESLWYVVSASPGAHNDDIMICNTTSLWCSFTMPDGVRGVSVRAYNTAGHSPETDVIFSNRNGHPASGIQASPHGDHSLRIDWEPQASASGYVLEWCKYSQHPDCEISWKTEPGNSSGSILQDNIEPLQLYTVWLYPLYEGSVGSPVQTEAYSKQGAPAFSPKLTLRSVSKSQAELAWEPVPLERRHGFITSYTVFWADETGKEHYAALNGSSRKFVIRNLHPFSTYKVLLGSFTAGGSVNGTVLMLHTTLLDEVEIHMLLIALCLACALAIIAVFTLCLRKHARMKRHFWPSVPDPANSSLGRWSPTLQENPKMAFNIKDVSQMITSDVTILEGWTEKKLPLADPPKRFPIIQKGYFQEHSVQPLSTTHDIASLRSYINVADTVQYAKVITGGYRGQSPPSSLYLRSDSTQPLLCDMTPSPKRYENMWFHETNQDDSVFLVGEETLSEFPLLQGLKIQEEGESLSF